MKGNYTAWLVEDRATHKYLAFDDSLEIVWVEEADDAIHLARREDAERLVINADSLDLSITDHQWVGGMPRPPIVQAHDWRQEEGEG